MKREIFTGFVLGMLIAAVFWAFTRELPRRAQADHKARCVLDGRAERMH